MASTRVSVLIPCHNAAQWIDKAVRSCLVQTSLPLEIIVVDDGSTDGSVDVIRTFGSHVTLLRVQLHNAAASRNVAMAQASGDFIQFLDADDELVPDKIGRQMEAMDRTGADIAYSDWDFIGDLTAGNVGGEPARSAGPVNDLLEALLSDWWVPLFAYLYRATALTEAHWNPNLPSADDFDFNLQVALAGPQTVYVPGMSGHYRMHSTQQFSRRVSAFDVALARDLALRNVMQTLARTGALTLGRRRLLAEALWGCAAVYYARDRGLYGETLTLVHQLVPSFVPRSRLVPRSIRYLTARIGTDRTNWLRCKVRTLRSIVRRVPA